MSEPKIHVFRHSAMATEFQVRIADEEHAYAAQTAQAAFALLDGLESALSRFQANSEISLISRLSPNESQRLSEPVFACLQIAHRMEFATRRAFSITPTALQTQPALPLWSLAEKDFSLRCESGRLEFDLGAIGKGFALDRMAETLREWDCPAFLLVAGGSSILAGKSPGGTPGWDCGLGNHPAGLRLSLRHYSLSGSGLAVKGSHIFDPRTGNPATRLNRAWALTDSGAESDALSTACMVLNAAEVAEIIASHSRWKVFLHQEDGVQEFGTRPN
jgi:thiamine biosynthesis lipoprotein